MSEMRMKDRMRQQHAVCDAPPKCGGDSRCSGDASSGSAVTSSPGGSSGDDYKCTNLIVNYLPQTMSQEEIKSLFASIGEIESCKLIRDKATGQSLGYGFINYKMAEHAQKAVESLNGLRLQNKIIKVSLARPSCEMIKGANLYVSGLPKTMTQRELERLFEPCGNIITSRILSDPQTGLSKGVGFVRFDMRTEADIAILELNGKIPEGGSEPLVVKFANHPSSLATTPVVMSGSQYGGGYSPRGSHSGGAHKGSSNYYRYNDAGGALCLAGNNTNNNALSYNMNNNNSSIHAPPSLSPPCAVTPAGTYCLFVYNLAPETEENCLWHLFGPFGAVQSIRVMRDGETHRCKGFAFVTMSKYDEALLAISYLHGYRMGSRVLQVSFKRARGGSMYGGASYPASV